MKFCPKCQRTWPDSGRFCPMDGASLEAVKAAPAAAVEPLAAVTSPATPIAKATRSIPVAKVEPARKATRGTQSLKAVRKAAVDDEAETKVLPAVPAAKPAPAPKPATATGKVAAAPKAKKDGFSETKWFQAGELVKDDEIGPEVFPAQALEPRYRKTHELPADVRKKFSLDRDGGTKE